MSCCGHCRDAGEFFGDRTARRELKRYRRRGPRGSTRKLLGPLHARFRPGMSVLDIGGGVGAVQHALAEAGAAELRGVDAAPAFVEAARDEARRRGYAERSEQRLADFVEVADEVPAADVVTLDRVICCYPDMPRLVSASAAKARALYGFVVPRERLLVRLGVRIGNFLLKLRGSEFRAFVHPLAEIERELRARDLAPVHAERTFIWEIRVFAR